MTALVVALAIAVLLLAVLLLAVLVAGLLRSHAEILRALHELGAGLELDRADGPVDVTISGVRTPRRTSSAETADAVSGQTLDGEAYALSLTTGTVGYPVGDERYLRDSPFKRFGSPPRREVDFERGTLSYDERTGVVVAS